MALSLRGSLVRGTSSLRAGFEISARDLARQGILARLARPKFPVRW